MFKGYRNYLLEKNKTNKSLKSLENINKCIKCKRLNSTLYSVTLNNIQNCIFCGNPFYIVKADK